MLATKPVLSKASQDKLKRLRAAAHHLFINEGYENTRPQDIAREAGVANGTFYRHFDGKQAVFLDFAQQAQQLLIQRFAEKLQGVVGLRNRWRVIVETVIEHALSHPGELNAAFLDPILIAPDNPNAWQLYERMGKFVDLALDRKEDEKEGCEMQSDLNLDLISHGIAGMLRHAMTYASRDKSGDICAEKLADELSLFIHRGLGFQENGFQEKGFQETSAKKN